MRKESRIVYISDDGHEFETEQQCLDFEKRRRYLDVSCLTNKQLVELITQLFHGEFNYMDDSERTLKIQVRIAEEREVEFLYTFDNYPRKGVISGYGYDDIRFYGSSAEVGKEDSYDWLVHAGFGLRRLYKYLESISFFDEQKEVPLRNRNLNANQYTTIYNGTAAPGKPFLIADN